MNTHPFLPLFDNPDVWQVFASGQAEGKLSRTDGPGGQPGLRLDFDFHGWGLDRFEKAEATFRSTGFTYLLDDVAHG